MELLDLLDDVFVCIVKLLLDKDVLFLTSVCKQMKDKLKLFEFKEYYHISFVKDFAKEHQKMFTALDISSFTAQECLKVPTLYTMDFRNIRKLGVTWCDLNDINMLETFPCLHTLEVKICHFQDAFDAQTKLEGLKNLKVLEVMGISFLKNKEMFFPQGIHELFLSNFDKKYDNEDFQNDPCDLLGTIIPSSVKKLTLQWCANIICFDTLCELYLVNSWVVKIPTQVEKLYIDNDVDPEPRSPLYIEVFPVLPHLRYLEIVSGVNNILELPNTLKTFIAGRFVCFDLKILPSSLEVLDIQTYSIPMTNKVPKLPKLKSYKSCDIMTHDVLSTSLNLEIFEGHLPKTLPSSVKIARIDIDSSSGTEALSKTSIVELVLRLEVNFSSWQWEDLLPNSLKKLEIVFEKPKSHSLACLSLNYLVNLECLTLNLSGIAKKNPCSYLLRSWYPDNLRKLRIIDSKENEIPNLPPKLEYLEIENFSKKECPRKTYPPTLQHFVIGNKDTKFDVRYMPKVKRFDFPNFQLQFDSPNFQHHLTYLDFLNLLPKTIEVVKFYPSSFSWHMQNLNKPVEKSMPNLKVWLYENRSDKFLTKITSKQFIIKKEERERDHMF